MGNNAEGQQNQRVKQEKLSITRDEYREIRHLTEFWVNQLEGHNRLLFPLAIAVFAFLGSQLPQFARLGVENYSFGWGGGLLAIILLIWRLLCKRREHQIVSNYPREVKLEKTLNFETRTEYIYRNLTKRSKEYIAGLMGKRPWEIKGWHYVEFVKHSKNVQNTCYQDQYDYLLAALSKFGYRSVGTRGNWIWDLSAGLLFFLWVAVSTVWVIIDPIYVAPF